MVTLIICIIIWTILSIWFFLSNLGDKDGKRKEKWYDLPLMVPAIAIICVFVFFKDVKQWLKLR